MGLLEPGASNGARRVLRGPRRSNAPGLPDYWAVDALQAVGASVHLAHPLGVKAFEYRRVKNDLRDATDLADLLRMGRLPEAWIAKIVLDSPVLERLHPQRVRQMHAGAHRL